MLILKVQSRGVLLLDLLCLVFALFKKLNNKVVDGIYTFSSDQTQN